MRADRDEIQSKLQEESGEQLRSRAGSRVRDLGQGIDNQGITLREVVMEVLDCKS